jgi:hypothetical protein
VTINTDVIIEIGKILGAVGVIAGVVFAFVKWILKQDKQSKDIKDLRNNHDEDLKDIQEELCVLNYAVLAALDALKQQGYNGGVTDARDKLEKHINNKAHKK